jgi:hypothetical protein
MLSIFLAWNTIFGFYSWIWKICCVGTACLPPLLCARVHAPAILLYVASMPWGVAILPSCLSGSPSSPPIWRVPLRQWTASPSTQGPYRQAERHSPSPLVLLPLSSFYAPVASCQWPSSLRRTPLTEAPSGHCRARMVLDQALAHPLLIACPQLELYHAIRLLPQVTAKHCLPPSQSRPKQALGVPWSSEPAELAADGVLSAFAAAHARWGLPFPLLPPHPIRTGRPWSSSTWFPRPGFPWSVACPHRNSRSVRQPWLSPCVLLPAMRCVLPGKPFWPQPSRPSRPAYGQLLPGQSNPKGLLFLLHFWIIFVIRILQ